MERVRNLEKEKDEVCTVKLIISFVSYLSDDYC